jgi:hypothetical protein
MTAESAKSDGRHSYTSGGVICIGRQRGGEGGGGRREREGGEGRCGEEGGGGCTSVFVCMRTNLRMCEGWYALKEIFFAVYVWDAG